MLYIWSDFVVERKSTHFMPQPIIVNQRSQNLICDFEWMGMPVSYGSVK